MQEKRGCGKNDHSAGNVGRCAAGRVRAPDRCAVAQPAGARAAILIAESDKVAARALEAGLQPVSLLVGEKWLQPLSGLLDQVEAAAPGTPVFVLPPEELQRLTGFELTRGLLAAFRRPAPLTVAQAVEGARLVAVLENITNHTNVGAIFRSAAALGADAGASVACLLRPVLPPRGARFHGHGVPDSLGAHSRRR